MKVVIAGSRGIALCDIGEVVKASGFDVTEVICGGATGVDSLGEAWAKCFDIPLRYFRPDWEQYGRAAGPVRNGQMAKYGDALIAIWDGKSRGTKSMIAAAKRAGLPVYVALCDQRCRVTP